MKIMLLGSCLSSLVLTRLKATLEYSLCGVFTHLRSDAISELIENNAAIGCPVSEVPTIIGHLQPALSNNYQKDVLARRVTAQSTNKLANLKPALQKCKVLIFDNNYDLERHLYDICLDGNNYRFSNLNVLESDSVRVLPSLDASEIANIQSKLFKTIIDINPSIKIFYFNYPVTAFENRAMLRDHARAYNARAVNEHIRRNIENGLIPENLVFISCIDLPERMLSEKGVFYFKDEVYQTFAKLIESKLEGKIEGRYFDDFSALQSQLGMTASKSLAAIQSPYSNLPDRQYWKPAVAEPYPLAITDLYRKKFDISIEDGVATCGSCFAQHIGKRLERKGYNYLDVEPVPADLAKEKAKALGYGIYSARYGNVYTSRQLVQLFDRAFGALSFDEVWQDKAGRYVDPFRPNLCGEGYTSAAEVLEEQQKHLQNVRHMFETLDAFVFTMGVTETWINRQTGAVYPICPGVTAGTFDPNTYEFVNLDYATILDEMETFLSRLREVNPKAKVLLTVSPVPLTATAEERHVLLSTMASKSILRAVADQLYRRHAHVDYFPSYDIIMSPPFKSMFFKNNLRSIHEEGVDYVMSHFFAEHQLEGQPVLRDLTATGQETADETKEEEDDEAFCDEAFLELERKTNQD